MVIKLYYFNGRGICEPIRWILSYGGVEFEDIRAPVNDQPLMLQTLPADIKQKCRWQQAPLVEFDDGTSLTQSLAICRYFAKKCNLCPGTAYEDALCDEYVDAIRDYWNAFFNALVSHTLDEFNKTKGIKYLDRFELIIKENNGNPFLIGDSMTWADIWLTFAFQHITMITNQDVIQGYQHLQKNTEVVVNASGIKEWIDKRPLTKF